MEFLKVGPTLPSSGFYSYRTFVFQLNILVSVDTAIKVHFSSHNLNSVSFHLSTHFNDINKSELLADKSGRGRRIFHPVPPVYLQSY